jgi:hypothetical protein
MLTLLLVRMALLVVYFSSSIVCFLQILFIYHLVWGGFLLVVG